MQCGRRAIEDIDDRFFLSIDIVPEHLFPSLRNPPRDYKNHAMSAQFYRPRDQYKPKPGKYDIKKEIPYIL